MPETFTLEDVIVYAYRPPVGGGVGGTGSDGTFGVPDRSRSEALDAIQTTFAPSCGQLSTLADRIDDEFLIELEGGSHASGYVPSDDGVPREGSGVTVGVGFDLGQRNTSDLAKFRFTPWLTNILTPYLGLRGAAAQNYLTSHPLTLHPQVMANLNHQVFLRVYSDIYLNYEAHSNFDFWRLPGAAQTVLVSVAWQMGPNLHLPAPDGAPIFFAAMTEGRWADALAELRDFGDDFPTRRNAEGDILEAALENDELPDSC